MRSKLVAITARTPSSIVPSRPSRATTPCVLRARDHDQRHARALIALGRLEDRRHVAIGRYVVTPPSVPGQQVLEARVRERAAHMTS